MKTTPSILLTASTLALLSACGGGGGGDSGGTGGGTGAAPVAITSGNQTSVARATVAGSFPVAQTQTAGGASPAAAPVGAQVLNAALRQAMAALAGQRRSIQSATAHPAATSSQQSACGVSGTLTVTFDDRDNNGTESVGDVVTVAFSQCRDSSTTLLNGSVVVTLTSVPTSAQIGANASLQSFTVVDGGLTSTINGTAALTETDTDTESDDTLTIASGGLSVGLSSANYNDTINYSSGMRIVTRELSNGQTSLTLDGSFTASSIGGQVTLATLVPVVQLPADTYPSSGQVRVTGASGSTLLMTAANATQVQLQLDSNGDGSYDSTTLVNWSTLLPQ